MFKAMRNLKKFHKLPEEYRRIVFFSEGPNYWNTMKPLVRLLLKKSIAFAYLSMDSSDPGLNLDFPKASGFCVGSGSGFIYFMSMLKAKIVVMTTPGLQTLTLKRSPGVQHYVHIVHAPVGISSYRKNSFDHFDTVMCSGPHQITELRKLEELRGTRKKSLLETGCAYMDLLKEKVESAADQPAEQSTDQPAAGGAAAATTTTVLVAPTWGANGALGRYGMKLLQPLIDKGYHIIVRPHPQQLSSEKPLITSLKEATSGIDKLRWDENPSGHESMAASDIMISDISGVIYDYAFVYEKPVITLDFELETRGFELEDLDGPVWEREVSRDFGAVVAADKLESLPTVIEDILSKDDIRARMQQVRKESLFNYGSAGSVAVEQLLAIQV